jgi:hypothetical protein
VRGNAACGGNLVQILVARDLRERASILRGFRDAAIDDAVKMTLEVSPLSRPYEKHGLSSDNYFCRRIDSGFLLPS